MCVKNHADIFRNRGDVKSNIVHGLVLTHPVYRLMSAFLDTFQHRSSPLTAGIKPTFRLESVD